MLLIYHLSFGLVFCFMKCNLAPPGSKIISLHPLDQMEMLQIGLKMMFAKFSTTISVKWNFMVNACTRINSYGSQQSRRISGMPLSLASDKNSSIAMSLPSQGAELAIAWRRRACNFPLHKKGRQLRQGM